MSKMVWKVRPQDYWRIGEHESWFTQLAAEGLHLKKMGPLFARFEKGTPKLMNYRIDVSKKLSDEQLAVYEEAGWDYITSFQSFRVFASPTELQAKELHTDPAEQAFTFNDLNKQLRFQALFTVIASLFSIGVTWAIWFLDGTPLLKLVEGGNMMQLLLTMYMVLLAAISLRAFLSIRYLRKNLMEGKGIDHQASWKKGKWFNNLLFPGFVVIFFVCSVVNLIQLRGQQSETLPLGAVEYPFIRLAELEQNPSLVRDEYWYDGVDVANSYMSKWSLLAPVQYEMSESGLVPDIMWHDGSGVYSPSIELNLFHVRWAWLSGPLVDDLVTWYSYDGYRAFQTVEHAVLDKLAVREDQGEIEVIASKGKRVLFMRYYGYSETDVVEKIVDVLTK